MIALNLPKAVPELLLFGRHVVVSMKGSLYLPSPSPPLAILSDDLDTLEAAEVLVLGRGLGAVAARDLAQRRVEADLEAEKAYVLWITVQTPELADAIITSSGMTRKKFTKYQKPFLDASMGPAPGQVILRAKAVARKGASYEWQFSSDGGETWLTSGYTTMADTSVPGLTPGTTYLFRFRSTIRRVTSDWSQSLRFVAH